MKKTVIICLLVAILAVGSCSKQVKIDNKYSGEAGDWSGEYRTVTTGRWFKRDGSESFYGKTEKTLTITYKKDIAELSAKNVVVSYDTGVTSGSRPLNSSDALPPHSFTVLHESGENYALETEYSVVKITIDIDGSVQTLELNYVK